MSPYTAEEAEWLSVHAGRPYWLGGQGDVEPTTLPAPANDLAPPRSRLDEPR